MNRTSVKCKKIKIVGSLSSGTPTVTSDGCVSEIYHSGIFEFSGPRKSDSRVSCGSLHPDDIQIVGAD